MAEDLPPKSTPNLLLAQHLFELHHAPSDQEKEASKRALMEAVESDGAFPLLSFISSDMAPFYAYLCDEHGFVRDEELFAKLSGRNTARLKELEDKIADAGSNEGESEIREAFLAKSMYLASIGDKQACLSHLRETAEKTVAGGQRLDLVFLQIRLGFLFGDDDLVARNLSKATTLAEEGGDWDRRNRLKVYEGLHRLKLREFKKAAELFLATISTFSCPEVVEYDQFVFYTIISSMVALDRVTLKEKVIDCPEVLQVINKLPHAEAFIQSLYKCDYALLFESLAALTVPIKKDRLLRAHCDYYCREIRIVAYAQLLESYRSVSLESMAKAFGVSSSFLDLELARFIADGRLNCKVDKVSGTVEINRTDAKSAQYQAVLKRGDIVLNRIGKLGRWAL